jgi:hypothetical protein
MLVGAMPTYSVAVRMQRLTTEEAWVSVPVTHEVMKDEPEPDGTFRVSAQKLREAALVLGAEPKLRWTPEGPPLVTLHPEQRPPPRDPPGGSTSEPEEP